MTTTERAIPGDAWVQEHDGEEVEVTWTRGTQPPQTARGRMRRDEHQGGDFFYLGCDDGWTHLIRRHEVVAYRLA